MSTQSFHRLSRVFARALGPIGLAFVLSACGAGTKVVSNVAFSEEVSNGDLYAGIDTTLTPGSLTLPVARLPLYNPKNPSQTLGELMTSGQHIVVRVNASEALKLPDLVDGTKLPNGTAIPLLLPSGLRVIGIPVFNSHSLVYFAMNGNQILLGVAVSILKEDALKIPLNLFLPFDISPKISGTAGFFLGERQGVAVFALRDSTKILALRSSESMEKIDVKSEEITPATLKQFQRAQRRLGSHVQID